MKQILLSLVLAQLSGCVSMNYHCEGSNGSLVLACNKARLEVMKAIPPKCYHGADGKGRIYGKSVDTDTKHISTVYRSEASMECKEEEVK